LLKEIEPNNAQKEYYLTDIIALTAAHKLAVHAHQVPATRALLGINSREELAAMEAEIQTGFRKHHMANGVTLTDPATVWFSLDTQIAADVTIGQNVVFGPGVSIEANVQILPFCHIEGAHIKSGARVGPFARLRPGTELAENTHVGNFVELKNTTLGKGSKANHLSYIGDATVGEGTNLGAVTITANYNHSTKVKSRTTIGNNVSTGALTTLVAPVKVGNDATIGAGTTLRQDAEAGTLVVALTTTKTKANYAATKRRK
jgi:bifunctional UDP-N-acetylglucosamine pyrophosphorylase/glucosamine-1-phosphate N-acetyltransferase